MKFFHVQYSILLRSTEHSKTYDAFLFSINDEYSPVRFARWATGSDR